MKIITYCENLFESIQIEDGYNHQEDETQKDFFNSNFRAAHFGSILRTKCPKQPSEPLFQRTTTTII